VSGHSIEFGICDNADTVFTERYMGLPNFTDNFKGYEVADVKGIANHLKDKKFFIVHGTADLSVHYQHTLYLTKALINDKIAFTEQVLALKKKELYYSFLEGLSY